MTGLLHGQRAKFASLVAGALVLVVLAVASVIYIGGDKRSVVSDNGNKQAASASSRPFVIHEAPRPIPEIAFENGNGQTLTLANFKGKTVLLNIWATWCIPCREEMPTLDALQGKLGSSGFEVVALSIDRAGPAVIRKFYTEIGIKNLGLYIDASMRASVDLRAVGLPTTLLIDAKGRELGRLVGPAKWDTPEMIAFLKTHLNLN